MGRLNITRQLRNYNAIFITVVVFHHRVIWTNIINPVANICHGIAGELMKRFLLKSKKTSSSLEIIGKWHNFAQVNMKLRWNAMFRVPPNELEIRRSKRPYVSRTLAELSGLSHWRAMHRKKQGYIHPLPGWLMTKWTCSQLDASIAGSATMPQTYAYNECEIPKRLNKRTGRPARPSTPFVRKIMLGLITLRCSSEPNIDSHIFITLSPL